MSIQDIVAEMIPTLEPAFANPSTLPTPEHDDGSPAEHAARRSSAPVPALFPAGTDVIQKSVEMFYGDHAVSRRDQPPEARQRRGRHA